jgi:hypothetical protein
MTSNAKEKSVRSKTSDFISRGSHAEGHKPGWRADPGLEGRGQNRDKDSNYPTAPGSTKFWGYLRYNSNCWFLKKDCYKKLVHMVFSVTPRNSYDSIKENKIIPVIN